MAGHAASHPGEQTPPPRRQEVLEWQASLATRSDAEVLGIRAGARPSELRAAFATLARRFHPDTAGPDERDLREPLQAIFVRVTEAYRNLVERSQGRVFEPAHDRVRSSVRPAGAREAEPAKPARQAAPAPAAAARRSPAEDAERRQARVALALRSAEELVARGRIEEAVAELHEVLTQADEPWRRKVRLMLARAYAADGRHRRYAVALLRELIEQGPADAEALAELGALYRREGLLARAEPLFARALALDPGLASARDGLRAVRAALAARQAPKRRDEAPRRNLIARLLSVAR